MEAANNNRTKIYRIRRKEDGLFLFTLSNNETGGHRWKGTWQPIGAFWRLEETIRRHLLELCTYRVYISDRPIESCGEIGNVPRSLRRRGTRKNKKMPPQFSVFPYDCPVKTVGVFFEFLQHYEVVVTDITVHGENTMEAVDFVFSPLPCNIVTGKQIGRAHV